MKTGYKVAATVALVAVGASGFYARSGREHAADRPGAPASVTLPSIGFTKEEAASITKIDLTQGEPRQTITLEREATGWRVTSPVRVRASDSKVSELLENLRGLRLIEAVDRGIYSFDLYELTDALAFHVTAWSSDRKVSDLYFGKSDTLKRFVRVADTPGAFAVANSGPGGYLGFLYTRGLRSWRETSILAFSTGDATEAEVTNPSGRFSFVKNGNGWAGSRTMRDASGKLHEPELDWTKFDESKVTDLLIAFKSLGADDFGDEAQKAESGVDHAEETGGVVRIRLKDGREWTLRVGRIATNTGRWAIKGSRWATLDGGDGTLYALAPWTVGWATADASRFERGEGSQASIGPISSPESTKNASP